MLSRAVRSRSHIPLWDRHWDAMADGQTPDGYLGPTMDALKAEREPIECHGPAGTVVLWHGTVARKQISIPSRFAALSVSLTLESATNADTFGRNVLSDHMRLGVICEPALPVWLVVPFLGD
eukprot:COSAG04_NODE_3126_length_3141_cov_5.249178_3_plen_122_part_00